MKIPQLLLRQLYTFGSLINEPAGCRLSLKNRLSDVTLIRISRLRFNDLEVLAKDLQVDFGDGHWRAATEVTAERPEEFPLRRVAHLRVPGRTLPDGTVDIEIGIEVKGVGALVVKVKDHVAAPLPRPKAVPYSKEDNYSPAIIRQRQQWVEQFSGTTP
jgi:hydroxymethylglutaryl-CoA reductase (NADPH)